MTTNEFNTEPSIKDHAVDIKDRAADLTESIKDEAKAIYNEGTAKAQEAYTQVKNYASNTTYEAAKSLTTYMQKDPVKSVIVAAVAGMIFGLLLHKK